MLLTSLGQIQIPASSMQKISAVQASSEAAPAITQAIQQTNVQTYGHAAAILIMTEIRRLPEDVRMDFLKRTLDAMDPALWPTVNEAATRYVQAGQDAMIAYLAALSQNLSNELIVRLGQIGAEAQTLSGLGQTMALKTFAQAAIPNAPAPGTCTVDQLLIWTGTAWRRRRASEPCQAISDHKINVQTTGQGGVVVTETTMVQAGPFTFPAPRSNKLVWIYDDYSLLTPEQAAFIREALSTKIDDSSYRPRYQGSEGDAEPGSTQTLIGYQSGKPTGNVITAQWPTSAPWGGTWLTWGGWLTKIGINQGDLYDRRYLGFNRSASSPIAKFTNPVNGQEWGLWIDLGSVGPDIQAISSSVTDASGATRSTDLPMTTKSVALRFMVAPVPEESWWDAVKGAIKFVIAKFYEFIIDVGKEIADLMCAIAANPAAAVTGATTAGGPAAGAAVGAGALILGSRCKEPDPPSLPDPPPDAPEVKGFPWGPVIAGGIALTGLVAFLLTPPKKKTPREAT